MALTTTIGTPIEPRNPNPHFYRLLDRTGLRHVRFHGLRRSCVIYVEVTRHAQRSPTDNLGFLFEN